MSEPPRIPAFGDVKFDDGESVLHSLQINPVEAARSWLQAAGFPHDGESFDRVAELVGDATPEQVADGFFIYGFDELQRLCDIGNFVIGTPPDQPDGSPIRAYTAGEWARMQGNLQ